MDDKVTLSAITIFLFFCGVHCADLEYKTFRCSNGTYIGDHLVCNGRVDCINDGVDDNPSFCETDGDDKIHCGPGKFRCKYDECTNVTARCNTRSDCSFLNVDEQNCGDEVNTYDCQLGNGKYLCQDGLRCLDFIYTCDGFCNCFDCSDEKSACSLDGYVDSALLESSHQACFKTPQGPVCCSELDSLCQECDSNEICDQKCIKFVDKTGCFCDENYIGVPGTNNTECFPSNKAAKEELLLYSTDHSIEALNLFTNTNFTVKQLVNSSGYWLTALTAFQDYVYYASFYPELRLIKDGGEPRTKEAMFTSIFKTSINSNETYEIMKSDSSSWKINSLAVDWITSNIYYATRELISVCSNDCRICIRLKSDKAAFINLASRHGLMFWISNWKIMKSSMDGSEEISIHTLDSSSKYATLDTLTVDELTERIYWHADYDRKVIHSVTFNGDKEKIWPLDFKLYYWASSYFSRIEYLFWDMGIYFEGEIFFNSRDGYDRRICSVDKKTNTLVHRFPVPKGYEEDYSLKINYKPKLLHVYNPFLQHTKILNPCPTSCIGLCLTRPSSNKGLLNYTCLHYEATEVHHTSASFRTETFKILIFAIMILIFLFFVANYI